MKTYDIGTEAWRAPELGEGEKVLFDEPGRVLDRKSNGGNFDVCFRSYHYQVVKMQHGRIDVRVKHGGGVECRAINRELVEVLEAQTSNARFFTLHALMSAFRDGKQHGFDSAMEKYQRAFVDGRLKKRKERGANRIRVWIEPASASV